MATVEPIKERTTTESTFYPVTFEFPSDVYQLFQAVSIGAGRSPEDTVRYSLGLLKLYDQVNQAGGKMLTQIGSQVQEIVNLG